MLKDLLRLDLQLFADGGDGGDGGESDAAAAESGLTPGEEEELARIPERGRKMYKEMVIDAKKTKTAPKPDASASQDEGKKHIPFRDLIKSDEYKEEFQTFMNKEVMPNRFKDFDGIKAQNQKMFEALSMVGDKYSDIDPGSDDYLDKVIEAIKNDQSYVESYAMDHDLSPEEAQKSLQMQKKISKYEAEKKAREEEDARNYQLQRLYASAEETKKLYPDFNLELEMQNPEFQKFCAITEGDTTKAYRSVHFDDLVHKQTKEITQKANQQIANNVAANKQRPLENGLSSQAASIASPNFDKMSAAELKAWGEEQRALKSR